MILITGATGYIGRHLVVRLCQQGEHPRCLVREVGRAAHLFASVQVELVEGDTTRPETLREAVRGVDTIIHAAFLTADRKETPGNRYRATNVGGTANLVQAAAGAGVGRCIEISGLGTRPDTPGSYMQGRYLAEEVVRASPLAWTIIQPSVLFGQHAPFLTALYGLIRTSPVVPLIGGGKVRFQPIWVEDVVSILLYALANPQQSSQQTLTVGGPASYSFAQLVAAVLQAMHKKRMTLPVPLPLAGVGASLMQALLPRPPLTRAALSLFSFDNVTDLDSVERQCGFTPRSFEHFLQEQYREPGRRM